MQDVGARRRRGTGAREKDFEALYREAFPRIYNYLYYRLLDQATAEDIASTVFLKAHRAFDRFDPEKSSFTTWTYSIAHNELMNHYRRQRPVSDIDDVPEAVFATNDEYEEDDDQAQRVRELLAELSPEDREIVFLKYWEQMKNKDIAELLGMNASTVASRVARAMDRMRAASSPEDFM